MSTGLIPLVDMVREACPEEIAPMLFLGFTVQRMDFFKVKESWTVLLTADKAEFFHWLSEEKHFIIPRSQASQSIHILNRQQANNLMTVKRPSGRACFFKMTAANGEMLRDWMGTARARQGAKALMNGLYELIYRPVLHLS